MKVLITMASLALVAVACTSPTSSGGNATVSGNIVGKPVIVRDVVGLVGTQTQDGGQSSYAAVLLSDTPGTCAAAQQGGVRAATSRGNVLEIAATTSGSPLDRKSVV